MHSSRMRATCFNGDPGGVCLWVQRGTPLGRHLPPTHRQTPPEQTPPLHAGIHTPAQCILGYTPPCEQNHRQVLKITLPKIRLRAVMIKVPVLPEYGRMLSAWQEVTNPLTSRNAEMTKLASTDDNSGNEDLK